VNAPEEDSDGDGDVGVEEVTPAVGHLRAGVYLVVFAAPLFKALVEACDLTERVVGDPQAPPGEPRLRKPRRASSGTLALPSMTRCLIAQELACSLKLKATSVTGSMSRCHSGATDASTTVTT
jgi:hypothetical protein